MAYLYPKARSSWAASITWGPLTGEDQRGDTERPQADPLCSGLSFLLLSTDYVFCPRLTGPRLHCLNDFISFTSNRKGRTVVQLFLVTGSHLAVLEKKQVEFQASLVYTVQNEWTKTRMRPDFLKPEISTNKTVRYFKIWKCKCFLMINPPSVSRGGEDWSGVTRWLWGTSTQQSFDSMPTRQLCSLWHKPRK